VFADVWLKQYYPETESQIAVQLLEKMAHLFRLIDEIKEDPKKIREKRARLLHEELQLFLSECHPAPFIAFIQTLLLKAKKVLQ
ncbi:MAG TPA: hypothetical protein VN457_03660, partial [Chlamydiales bacterium]|nr:hypothetical protein [Chlamydiales bacterium]